MSLASNDRKVVSATQRERSRASFQARTISSRLMAPSFRQMQLLQAVSFIAFLYAVFWDRGGIAWWTATLGVYFLTGCLGLTVTMHRALTHKSLRLPRVLEVLFTLFGAIGGSGSSIAWTAMHRAHHAHVDGSEDPHAPAKLGWRLIFSVYDYDFDPRHAKDLLRDKFHLFLHRYYVVILMSWAIALAAIDFRVCLYLFFIPAFLQITVSNLTSLLTHSHGYRSFATEDHSVNNPLIALVGWGEGWHNNHHAAPLSWSFQRQWWEIDPGALVIALLMALGIVRREVRISSASKST